MTWPKEQQKEIVSMESEHSEIEEVTCSSDPTKNCTCIDTGFDSYSTDDSLREFSIEKRKYKRYNKRIVAGLRCFKTNKTLSVWRHIDRSRSSSLPSGERLFGFSATMANGSAKKSSKKTPHNLKIGINRRTQSMEISSSDEDVSIPEIKSQDHLLSSEVESPEHLLTSEDEKTKKKHKKKSRVSFSGNSLSGDYSLLGDISKTEEKLSRKRKKRDSISSSDCDQSGNSTEDGILPERKEKSSKRRKKNHSISSDSDERNGVSNTDDVLSEKQDTPRKKSKRKDKIGSGNNDQSEDSSKDDEQETLSKKHKGKGSIGLDDLMSSGQKSVMKKNKDTFKKPESRGSVSSSFEGLMSRQNGFTNNETENNLSENTTVALSYQPTKKVYDDKVLTQEEEEEVSTYSKLLGENFLDKNNVWLLQCPSSVDCSQLVKQYLNLDKNCRLRVGNTEYEALPHRSEGERHVTLAVPSSQHKLQITRIPIAGNIVLEEYIGVEGSDNFVVLDSQEAIQLPEDLRTRHPLLGLDYENQPRTAERIIKNTRIKKEKQLSFLCDVKDEVRIKAELPDYDSTVEPSPKKKKKKRQDYEFVSIKVEKPDYDSTVECTPKKSKKRKRESDASTHESEMSTSEQSPRKKKKWKQEMPDEITIKEEPVSEVKKKKKKQKSEDSS